MDASQIGMTLEDPGGFVRPMQASTSEAPFRSSDYLFEIKWDGLRALLHLGQDGRVVLKDRALNEITGLFPEFQSIARQLPEDTLLDGELVATDGEGRPDNVRLRHRMALGATGLASLPVAFVAFDLLRLRGRHQLREPLVRRRARLERSVVAGGHLFVPDGVKGDGVELFEACLQRGLEGIVAKHLRSTYLPGQRSPFWLSVKAVKSDDFVVVGSTPGEPFGALLLAFWEGDRLLPCGAVRGGWDDVQLEGISRHLETNAVERCPLVPPPAMVGEVRWCAPSLVVAARYSEWAPDGSLRFPIFDGLRPEVHPKECVRHRPRVVAEGAGPSRLSPVYSLTRFPF